MPRAYWVAHVTVDDPQGYEAYRAANGAAFARFGGRFLVRGGPQSVVEGTARPRTVVIEFASRADAEACYASAEYQAALALRRPCSQADVVIVDGWDDPAAGA
ncbi:DUF1330 domain-containing protein [Paracoccus sanguinis]|uniref:Uncharacterized conserved protein, DUF1330 family n=1 Tax=Paracoccus sanguinis TaxID=1545044 RepID=A0A1H2QR82_9RHOB|nr:DUF1330 domain-containing protein [Paracoccus sanguinis]KGJ16224.1 hypothetical protein IX57_13205 [Paracoccus sanguinis]SDW09672.1 Uncharacterized conserved protein, DUF1330 family [Paracoccus sanguinis]